MTDNDYTTIGDGLSQPLPEDTPPEDPPPIDAYNEFDGHPPADSPNPIISAFLGDATATVPVDVKYEIDSTGCNKFDANDRAMSSAIVVALATPMRTKATPAPAP